ncbi:MAG: hypothetical protein EPO08_17680 [Rhodospirillaceae bacterium]|nr:MAG: hypothetical protein EPO08_17680 [Rhodospirillaceae bacterium]
MRIFKLAMASVLALGLAVPAFAQTAATATVGTDTAPAKTGTKTVATVTADTKSDTKITSTTASHAPKVTSLHKTSHKKQEQKKTAESATSKM